MEFDQKSFVRAGLLLVESNCYRPQTGACLFTRGGVVLQPPGTTSPGTRPPPGRNMGPDRKRQHTPEPQKRVVRILLE